MNYEESSRGISITISAAIAKEAINTGTSVRKLILKEGILTEAELEEILDVKGMTEPGISGK